MPAGLDVAGDRIQPALNSLPKLLAFLKGLIANWISGAMFLLALGSTFATYIPSFYQGFHIPRWVPALFFVIAFLAASFRLFLEQEKKITAAEDETRELKSRIADLQDNAGRRNKLMLDELIADLEGNLVTARNNFAGMPGNRVYIRPSVQFWREHRADLGFLDGDLLRQVRNQYGQIERWYGIVEGGARPDIGNRDLDAITMLLQAQLPPLLERLRAALAATQ